MNLPDERRMDDSGPARNSVVAGILGAILAVLYLLTPLGVVTLVGALLCGLAGVVLGIVGLVQRGTVWMAITGILAGVVGLVVGIIALML